MRRIIITKHVLNTWGAHFYYRYNQNSPEIFTGFNQNSQEIFPGYNQNSQEIFTGYVVIRNSLLIW